MQQIRFWEMNKIDLLRTDITITATDAVATSTGQSLVNRVRNRDNNSAWLTTDSTDAANTEFLIEMGTSITIDTAIIVGHNLEDYTLDYWNGSAYVNFITKSGDTLSTTHHVFTEINTTKVKLTITGCQVVDADKVIKQLVLTKVVGQLNAYPVIKKPVVSRNKIKTRMLSGKLNMVESIESFSCSLSIKALSNTNDMEILENLYFSVRPFIVSLSGMDDSQFRSALRGYRNEDLFVMKTVNEYTPEWLNGVYINQKVKVDLSEVIE